MHQHVGLLFFGDGGEALFLVAFPGVIMADIDARVIGKRIEFLDGVIERGRAGAGKIRARRAHIGHEDGIAHEHRFAHMVAYTGGRMARRVDDLHLNAADGEHFAFPEQVVELRAVERGVMPVVQQRHPVRQHVLHMLADADPATQLFLQVMRRGQVVCMHMRFQYPLHIQPLRFHISDHRIGATCGRPARRHVVVEHGIDDGAVAGGRVAHHIGEGGSIAVKEMFNVHAAIISIVYRGVSFFIAPDIRACS